MQKSDFSHDATHLPCGLPLKWSFMGNFNGYINQHIPAKCDKMGKQELAKT